MQQLTRSHRRHTGPLTQRAWISRQDGSVTQQTIRTRPGYEETQWTIIETGEDIHLQQNPNPNGPSMHSSELEAVENAMERVSEQVAHLHALYSSLDERRMDLEEGKRNE